MMEFRLSASMISCLICLRQINIDFHNTNFRLMGDYEKIVEAFDAFIKSKHVIKSGERKNQEKRWESVGFLIPWAYGGGQREMRKGQDETEERYQIVTYGVGRDWIDSEEWGWLRMCG